MQRPQLDDIKAWRPGMGTLKIVVTLGLIGLLAYAIDLREAGRLLVGADLWLLLAGVAVLQVQTLVSAARWRLTAARLDHGFSLMRAMKEYYLAQFLNQTLPGGVIGDAGRAMRARHQAGLVRASQAVLFERLSGQLALIAVAAPGLLLTGLMPGGVTWPEGIGRLAMGVVAVLVLAPIVIWAISRVPGRIGRMAADVMGAAQIAVLARQVRHWQAGLSFGTVACNITAFAFCAAATGQALGFASLITVVPLVLLMMFVPISVAGWGLREGAAALLWPAIGLSGEAGVAASVAFGLVFLVSTLPGAAVLAWEARGNSDDPTGLRSLIKEKKAKSG